MMMFSIRKQELLFIDDEYMEMEYQLPRIRKRTVVIMLAIIIVVMKQQQQELPKRIIKGSFVVQTHSSSSSNL